MRQNKIKWVILLIFSFTVIFLMLPIASLFVAFKSKYFIYLKDRNFLTALLTSLKTTSVSLIIVIILGIPSSYYLARHNKKFKLITSIFIDLPYVLPPSVVGLLLLLTFGRNGIIGKYLYLWGIHIPFSIVAVIIAQVYISLPIFIKTVEESFSKIDVDIELAAEILGDSPLKSFLKITMPLSRNSILAASVLSWARALSEFGATIMFAGNLPGKTQTMPLAIYTAMERDINLSLMLSLVLLLMSALSIVCVKVLVKRSKE